MIPYEGFKERHYPQKKQWGFFSEQDLAGIGKDVPQDVIDFLTLEGLSSYSNHFLWTTLPKDFHDVLTEWGLAGNKCYTFMRSAFGACIFYSRKKYFYLDPLEGRVVSLGDDLYLLLNYMLKLDIILESGFFHDYFQNMKTDPQLLHPDEIFAFVPALPVGGSFEISSVEVVKMKEHLFFLAQLFDGKATQIK